jgi:hypothetical protein
MPTFNAAKAQMPIKNMRASQSGLAITPPLQTQFTSPNSIKIQFFRVATETSIGRARSSSPASAHPFSLPFPRHRWRLQPIQLGHHVNVGSDLYFFVQFDDVRVVHAKTAMRNRAAD